MITCITQKCWYVFGLESDTFFDTVIACTVTDYRIHVAELMYYLLVQQTLHLGIYSCKTAFAYPR